jgi:transposase
VAKFRTDTPFQWNKERELVAKLLAEDELTDDQIAATIGRSRQLISTWKHHPEFEARIDKHIAEWKRRVNRKIWVNPEKRIEALISDIRAIETILKERGSQVAAEASEDTTLEALLSEHGVNYAGGARTGYITRDFRGNGPNMRAVYQFDAALMRERRELMKHLAQELHQWEESKPKSDDRLDELVAIIQKMNADGVQDDDEPEEAVNPGEDAPAPGV